jgi:hypothetical protein|nr:MAG TPA: hypothetical protein [Caudoviricetes sp.]DAW78401.1 MAG TPA: hypothetical protein [Caudoviricetes sp.]
MNVGHEYLSVMVEQQKQRGRKFLGIDEVENMIAMSEIVHKDEAAIRAAELNGNAHLAAEHLKAMIGFAQSAIKSVLFINGGSVMMFVAFLGNNLGYLLENDFSIVVYQSLWNALVAFGVGAFFASLSYAISYLAQGFYTDEFGKIAFQGGNEQKRFSAGDVLRLTAIITCILAYAAMLVGMWFCASGLWVVNFLHK